MTKKWRSLVGKKVRLIGFVAAFCAVVANAREPNYDEEKGAPFEMPPIPVVKFPNRDFSISDFGAEEGVKATAASTSATSERTAPTTR